MVPRAKVRSVEALEQFRTSLVIYREKAGAALDEVSDEVIRTRNWIEGDRRAHWERERRRRQHTLEQKEQELFSARIAGFKGDLSLQQHAVAKARRAVEEAEEKLHCIRRWSQQFDSRVAPLFRRSEQLRHTLAQDMGEGVRVLGRAVQSLQAYAEVKPVRDTSGGRSTPPGAEATSAPDPAEAHQSATPAGPGAHQPGGSV
jgi:hypothetical protein